MIQTLDTCKIAEPVFLRNLLIYPVHRDVDNGSEVVSLDRILENEEGEFRELETPDINQVVFENKSEYPVLMLDGEEIIGSLQDRIVADSILVSARSTSDIPVICAEQGRWDNTGSFGTGHCSYPSIRAILSRRGKEDSGLQKKIWNEIERKLTTTKTLSTTSSMHDIYDNLQDELTRYLEDFEHLNHDTVGLIGVAAGQILGCDIFGSTKTYRMFENKLIRSYALDAVERRKPSRRIPDVTTFFQEISHSLENKKLEPRAHHFSLHSKNISGQGVIDQNRIIHLSAFPK